MDKGGEGAQKVLLVASVAGKVQAQGSDAAGFGRHSINTGPEYGSAETPASSLLLDWARTSPAAEQPHSCCRRRPAARTCLLLLVATAAMVLLWRALYVWACFPGGCTTVVLPDGQQLRGIAGDTREFRGIPYAQSPTHDRRWLPPQAPLRWTGELDATQHRPNCAQQDLLGYDWAWESLEGGLVSSEDCLYLTVYAPRLSQLRGVFSGTELRPVLVYLHGGANFNGGSNDKQLNGASLAADLNVLVVVPNFRLGIFGYLGSEALRQRAGGENASTGNYGHMDQRMALAWCQNNIRAFGGDPDRVLLMGESTGAAAVATHLISDYHHAPTIKPAFSASVLESGAMQPWVAKTMAEAEAVYAAILARTGCSAEPTDLASLACLLNKSTVEIYNASYAENVGDLPYGDSWESCQWAPVIDGVELSDTPLQLLRKWGAPPAVHVIVGSNRDEGTQSLYTDGGASNTQLPSDLRAQQFAAWARTEWGHVHGQQIVALYQNEEPPAGFADAGNHSQWWWAASRAVGDMLYTCPARVAARAMAKAAASRPNDGSGVWLYYFEQVPRVEAATYGLPGACHGCEMAFVWRNPAELDGAYELAISEAMSASWVSLATFGDPDRLHHDRRHQNSGGSSAKVESWPGWPRFPANSDSNLRADLSGHYRRSHTNEFAMSFGGRNPSGKAKHAATVSAEGTRQRWCDVWDAIAGHCADAYQQCGGQGWNGPQCCMTGCTCIPNSKFYSQCKPAANHSTCEASYTR